ncbi:unnamed protein product [Microthlaspi erraticum]|uniref:Uncharacterized protein n=1 Tax=Microthlaspi erraticum TaxID=1685480 RepID=A0A6D2HFN8_9BRAS|nr:unnamed protein product [Microthlaspi erraticum]
MSPAILVGPIFAVDAAVSRAIHTAAKPLLSPFLLLLLEISADFRFSFPLSLSLLLSLIPFRSVPFLLDLIFVGIVKLTFRRARPVSIIAVSAGHYSFRSGHALPRLLRCRISSLLFCCRRSSHG